MAEDKTIHQVQLNQRNRLEISGVAHVDSFDDDTIILATQMGTLTIKGHNLRIQHLDLDAGEFMAQGDFDALSYSQSRDPKGKHQGSSGWQRMWR